MGKSKKPYLIFFILLAIFLFLNISPAKAGDDDLDLTGIIESVDSKEGTVKIEVLNDGCKGIKKFKYDNTLKASDNIGKKVLFSLNSSTCQGNEIYKIKRIYYRWYDLPGGTK